MHSFFHWLLFRLLRPLNRFLQRVAVRAADAISPTLVYWLEQSGKDMQAAAAQSRHLSPLQVRFGPPGTGFALDVSAAPWRVRREYQQLAESGLGYEPVMTRCVTALWNGSPAGLFLDLGAFLGIYACQVAASNQTSGRIVAVESNPAYCRSIEMSVRLNGFSNVEVINAVASNDIHPVIVRDNTVTTSDEAHGNAHTTTIDRLCQERSLAPTLVKVDVHGTEGIVLQGMREILRQHVRFLLLESHSYRYLDRYSPGVTREEILELLIEAGFALFHVAGHRLHADDKQRACVRNGELAYRPIPPESPRQALFDRMDELFILAAKDPAELAACLGPPSDDPLWY